MKATGIVRRMDDLGRIVVPKEIRKTLRIRVGDPLEIFTSAQGEIIFKKYSPLHDLTDMAQQSANALYETRGLQVFVSDLETMIAVAGVPSKEYFDRQLTASMRERLEARQPIIEKNEQSIELVQGYFEPVKSYCIQPIITAGDLIGGVYVISKLHFLGEVEQATATFMAALLAKQFE